MCGRASLCPRSLACITAAGGAAASAAAARPSCNASQYCPAATARHLLVDAEGAGHHAGGVVGCRRQQHRRPSLGYLPKVIQVLLRHLCDDKQQKSMHIQRCLLHGWVANILIIGSQPLPASSYTWHVACARLPSSQQPRFPNARLTAHLERHCLAATLLPDRVCQHLDALRCRMRACQDR